MDETTSQAIDAMVSRLVERFVPQQIILFGSHARGTATPGSDVDLLVIMPVAGSKRAKQVELRVALHDIRVPNVPLYSGSPSFHTMTRWRNPWPPDRTGAGATGRRRRDGAKGPVAPSGQGFLVRSDAAAMARLEHVLAASPQSRCDLIS